MRKGGEREGGNPGNGESETPLLHSVGLVHREGGEGEGRGVGRERSGKGGVGQRQGLAGRPLPSLASSPQLRLPDLRDDLASSLQGLEHGSSLCALGSHIHGLSEQVVQQL